MKRREFILIIIAVAIIVGFCSYAAGKFHGLSAGIQTDRELERRLTRCEACHGRGGAEELYAGN